MIRLTKEQADLAVDFGSLCYDAHLNYALGERSEDLLQDYADHKHYDLIRMYCIGEMTYAEASFHFVSRMLEGRTT